MKHVQLTTEISVSVENRWWSYKNICRITPHEGGLSIPMLYLNASYVNGYIHYNDANI